MCKAHLRTIFRWHRCNGQRQMAAFSLRALRNPFLSFPFRSLTLMNISNSCPTTTTTTTFPFIPNSSIFSENILYSRRSSVYFFFRLPTKWSPFSTVADVVSICSLSERGETKFPGQTTVSPSSWCSKQHAIAFCAPEIIIIILFKHLHVLAMAQTQPASRGIMPIYIPNNAQRRNGSSTATTIHQEMACDVQRRTTKNRLLQTTNRDESQKKKIRMKREQFLWCASATLVRLRSCNRLTMRKDPLCNLFIN